MDTTTRSGYQHPHQTAHDNQIDEILENIWVYEEAHPGNHCTAECLKELKVTAEELEEMIRVNLITMSGAEVMLQEQAQSRVRRIIRAHRLAECLLSEAFSINEESMEQHACSFEHILCQPVLDSVCTLLGHPKYCPHGKQIPPGECCLTKNNNAKPIVFPLTDLDIEEEGKIVSILTQKHQRLDFLTSLGIHPGSIFFLESKKPVYVLRIGETRYAIEEDVVRDILVRRI